MNHKIGIDRILLKLSFKDSPYHAHCVYTGYIPINRLESRECSETAIKFNLDKVAFASEDKCSTSPLRAAIFDYRPLDRLKLSGDFEFLFNYTTGQVIITADNTKLFVGMPPKPLAEIDAALSMHLLASLEYVLCSSLITKKPVSDYPTIPRPMDLEKLRRSIREKYLKLFRSFRPQQ